MDQGDIYYRAMLARDNRFDGKFFVGVKTTGIYCRPICPARPKRENVEFFASAIAAERGGYRPCLRCRPESAPSTPAWNGKSAVVQRALRLIADPDAERLSEDRFAERLGVSARHLRRLFEDELGQTPKQIADNNRLGFARKLVLETGLPMVDIAFTSGFGSLRRFNDAFVRRFHRSPSEVRRHPVEVDSEGFVHLALAFRPPLDWESLFQFHQRHSIPGLERFDDGAYERVFEYEGSFGVCRVSFPDRSRSELQVAVQIDNPRALLPVTRRVRRMFDLDSDPLLIANHFEAHPELRALHAKYPGLRLPRGWDPFETAVATILGQLVSVEQGRRLMQALVQECGTQATHPLRGETLQKFPSPEQISNCALSTVRTTQARKNSLRALARAIATGKVELSDTQDPQRARELLREIPGIGAWSAEYIALRALGDTDAFPRTDLILKRALEKHPELDLQLVRPWSGYLAIYFWKEYAQSLSKKRGKSHGSV